MSGVGLAPIVSVEELRSAYRAMIAGQFRGHQRQPAPPAGSTVEWTPAPGEQIVLVVGATGGAGASTVALAVASCAGDARVVECCTVASSGLAGASAAEMGVTTDGWVQGTRGEVLIERRRDRVPSVEVMPVPSPSTRPFTVVDVSVDVDVLVASLGWLGQLARTLPGVVVVSRSTVPGLRRLEAATGLLGRDRVHAVLTGVLKRWPRQLEQHLGPHSRRLRAEGRLIDLPHDPRLAVEGITTDPLPAALLAGVAPLLDSLRGTSQ
jgi:hypothetical protein